MATPAAVISDNLGLSGIGGLVAGHAESAECFVYLHGWGGSKELWWNALNDLSGKTYGVSLDLPGTGNTTMQPNVQTMSDMAHWVADVCRQLRLNSVTLIGHSLGGNLAAQVALEFPDLVQRLVLVDAALETGALPRRGQWPLAPRYGMTALRLARLAAWPMALAGMQVPHNHNGGYWQPYARRVRLYIQSNTDEALQTQLRALIQNPLDANRLSTLNLPILIVHGAHDTIIPVARARALSHALTDAHLVVFPTAHHCPMDTDPKLFAQTVWEFAFSHPKPIKNRALDVCQ